MDKGLLKKLTFERRDLINSLAKIEMRDFIHKKILLVDDCVDTLKILEKMIQGFLPEVEVHCFDSEVYALKNFVDAEYDLLIIDINLSRVNGMNFSHALNSISMFKVPTIFISGDKTYDEKIKKCYDKNKYFLPKPVDRKIFIKQISKYLGKSYGFVS